MNYIVMECHEGYAVLMDEEARFVTAANLRYEIGQTVTDPVLMSADEGSSRNIKMFIGKLAAAAACLTLLSAGEYTYYAHNVKTYSTVLISSGADIKMSLNQKGEVKYLSSVNESGGNILSEYDGKGKDKITVVNEIIDIEKEKGYLNDGDTVDVYISTEKSSDYYPLKADFVNGINEPNLKISVSGPADRKKPEKPSAEPPKPDENKPVPKLEEKEKTDPKDTAELKVPEPPKPANQGSSSDPEPPKPADKTAPAPRDDSKTAPQPPSPGDPKTEIEKHDINKDEGRIATPEEIDPAVEKPGSPGEIAPSRPSPRREKGIKDKGSEENERLFSVLLPSPDIENSEISGPDQPEDETRTPQPEAVPHGPEADPEV